MKSRSSPARTKAEPKPQFTRGSVALMIAIVLAGAVAIGWILRIRAEERAALAQNQPGVPVQGTPENAEAARAIFHYLAKVEAQLRDHEAAFQRLQQHKVFAWFIRDRPEIETDRQLLRDYLATNARLTETMQFGADLVRADLNSAKVPAEVRDSALALYEKSQGPLIPLEMRIRQADKALAEDAIAVLDFLDLNWGEWRRNETNGQIDFDNSITLATFKDYAEKTKAAAVEREDAQQALINYQKLHTTPKPR